MMEIQARRGLSVGGEPIARQPGRPVGSKNNTPHLHGWHEEAEAARRLGEDIRTRARKRRLQIGPREWIKHGQHILYQDGCEEKYLASELAKRTATAPCLELPAAEEAQRDWPGHNRSVPLDTLHRTNRANSTTLSRGRAPA